MTQLVETVIVFFSGLTVLKVVTESYSASWSYSEPAKRMPKVGRRAWQPTLLFLPRESHGQRSLVGYSPWSCKELDRPKWLSMHVCPHPYPHVINSPHSGVHLRSQLSSILWCPKNYHGAHRKQASDQSRCDPPQLHGIHVTPGIISVDYHSASWAPLLS